MWRDTNVMRVRGEVWGRMVLFTAVIALVPGASTGSPIPVSEVAFYAIETAREIPPAFVWHEEWLPSPVNDTDLPQRACIEPCVTTPLQQGELVVRISAPTTLANAKGAAIAGWEPFNEFDGELLTFNENAEATLRFRAPSQPATGVGVRIFARQAEWEAVWLVVPEATL